MNKPLAEVIPLYESNYRDPAATLRVIADEIEAGKYGEVHEIALIMNTEDSVELFGMGKDHDTGTLCLLINAAMHKLAKAVDR